MKSVIMMFASTSMCLGHAFCQYDGTPHGGPNYANPVSSAFITFKEVPTDPLLPPLLALQPIPADHTVFAPPDSPLAGLAVSAVISFGTGVAAGVVANAIYDALTDQEGETETTTTDENGGSSEGGESTSGTGDGTETESHMSGPETPKQFSIGGTWVKNVFSGNTMTQRIGKMEDKADVLLTEKNIKSVNYKVVRTIRTELKRKSAFPKNGGKLRLDVQFDQLSVSTKDIPKTNGSSMITITIAGNGKTLYTFKASVDQGKTPSFSDPEAKKYVVKGENGVLIIKGLKKRVEFNAEPGRSSDEFVITILTEGIGKRI